MGRSFPSSCRDLKRDRRVDLFLFFSIGTAAWESLPDLTSFIIGFLHHSVRYFRTFSSLFRGGIKTTTNRWTPVRQPAIEPAFPCVTRIIFNLAKIFGYPLSNRSKSPLVSLSRVTHAFARHRTNVAARPRSVERRNDGIPFLCSFG